MHIIDTHNHSLFELDDGAKNLQMSLDMLKASEADGVKEVILTPHHLNGAFINLAGYIKNRFDSLKLHAELNNINVKLHFGSEVHLVPETVQHLVEGKALTYAGLGKAALVELPKHSIPMGTDSILSELIYHGITPIIAHPERNTSLRADPGQLKEWVAFGCKSQVTGQSCTGFFGHDLQKTAFDMISAGLVHTIASDAHRPRGRSPKLSDAAKSITEHYGRDICKVLFSENPSNLLNGNDLINITPIITKSPHKKQNKKKPGWLSQIIRPR